MDELTSKNLHKSIYTDGTGWHQRRSLLYVSQSPQRHYCRQTHREVFHDVLGSRHEQLFNEPSIGCIWGYIAQNLLQGLQET